jgi:pilus assembly protein CpaB
MFIAIALAAGAFFLTMHFTSNQEPDKALPVVQPQTVYKEVPTVDVYTAKQDIPIGAIIKADMLDIQPWPKHLKLDDMVEANPNESSTLVRMVARTPFSKGEPIMLNRLANEKDPSFLAASLPKGMRVVTIAVDPVSGVGGFVFPGDRVDVLITHDIVLSRHEEVKPDGTKTDPKKDPVTEVLLSNLRVMAVNQKSSIHSGEPPMVPSTVSLEVSATDAQKLRLTENGNGRLSLALRSLHDKDENELARPTGLGDLSRLTPPAYFPVLYDTNGQANYTPRIVNTPPTDVPEDVVNDRSAIIVVRGVTAEEVETSRP